MQSLERDESAPQTEHEQRIPIPRVTVGRIERALGLVGGGALSFYGVRRYTRKRRGRDGAGLLILLAGATVVARSLVPRERRHRLARFVRGEPQGPAAALDAKHAVRARASVTIGRDPPELYRFWRDVQNLPSIMEHVEAVRVDGGDVFHWIVKGPAGTHVAWDARIVADEENRLISWRSLDGADVSNAGSVRFRPAPGGRGTEVTVELSYEPPAGKVGATLARLLGEIPERQIESDLHRFKQLMETGEIPTTVGQPRGGRAALRHAAKAEAQGRRA
jgi:uncharacterized membrane protein